MMTEAAIQAFLLHIEKGDHVEHLRRRQNLCRLLKSAFSDLDGPGIQRGAVTKTDSINRGLKL